MATLKKDKENPTQASILDKDGNEQANVNIRYSDKLEGFTVLHADNNRQALRGHFSGVNEIKAALKAKGQTLSLNN